jgi:hypothetical protein
MWWGLQGRVQNVKGYEDWGCGSGAEVQTLRRDADISVRIMADQELHRQWPVAVLLLVATLRQPGSFLLLASREKLALKKAG